MSTIAGIFDPKKKQPNKRYLEQLIMALDIYGGEPPESVIHDGFSCAVRQHLATPEDEFEAQPAVLNGLTLAWDGRLDNRNEIGRSAAIKLEEHGNPVPDSLIVLRFLAKYGFERASWLKGDFAFALHSEGANKIFLFRDPMGLRPLYYTFWNGIVLFASMPKAFFAFKSAIKGLDENTFGEICSYVSSNSEETLFAGTKRVIPGIATLISEVGIEKKNLSELDLPRAIYYKSTQEYVEHIEQGLELAVQRRMRALGPLGCELSSGLDSGIVLSSAARQLQSSSRLRAYTYAPVNGGQLETPSRNFPDESYGSSLVASRFSNVDHQVFRFETRITSHLEFLTMLLDEPVMNICNCSWIFDLIKSAGRDGVKVLLRGAAGNLTISYSGEKYLPGLLARGNYLRWITEFIRFRKMYPKPRLRSLAKYGGLQFPRRRREPVEAQLSELQSYSAASRVLLERILGESVRDKMERPKFFVAGREGVEERLKALKCADFSSYSLAANHFGITLADPTADIDLVRLCLAVPESVFWQEGVTRGPAKSIFSRLTGMKEQHAPSRRGLQGADWYKAVQREQSEVARRFERYQELPYSDLLDLPGAKRLVERIDSNLNPKVEDSINAFRIKMLRTLTAGAFLGYYCDQGLKTDRLG